MTISWGLPAPSRHALELAGVDLVGIAAPFVRVLEAREVVVVLSRSRDPAREVYLTRCQEAGIPVVVRPSGGGAVVLAPGVVGASVVAGMRAGELFPEPYFARFGAAVTRALAASGVGGVTTRGFSDLCLGDRKIAGSSLRLWGGRVLYQVSLLVDLELELLERLLATPSRAPAYRHGRPHREFVTSLRAAGFSVTTAVLAEALRCELAGEAGGTARA